jgi:glycerate dehydrogenase
VISLHVPLFPSTNGMINKDSIAKMKKGVIIINTSAVRSSSSRT